MVDDDLHSSKCQQSWLLALKKHKIFKEDNGFRGFYSVWIMT